MTRSDPLWAPILTHYRRDQPGVLDADRVLSHLESLQPFVRQFLVAGTTGDGWGMRKDTFERWLAILRDPRLTPWSLQVMIGVLEPTTEDVIRKARQVEAWLADHALAVGFAGLTVCPPVEADASQERIAAHFKAVIAATRSPIAVYQLPQVTGCEIAPETFSHLVASTDRIRYLKDSSGADVIVQSGLPTGDVIRLRGAEGDYARHKAPRGDYHGWLLSTANGFAPVLRSIADALAAGDLGRADRDSDRLTEAVEALFALAAKADLDNPFSLANRLVDHLCWAGSDWPELSGPLTRNGDVVGHALLAEAAGVLERRDLMPTTGYGMTRA